MNPLYMFYDTETTGIPDWSKPSEGDSQPHIVQFAAALIDSVTREPVATVNLTAKPDGWEIPDEVVRITGITTEQALHTGIDERALVQIAYAMGMRADLRIGHVETFDARICRIGFKRFGYSDADSDAWKARNAECTAKLARAAMKHPKNPTLSAAYEHFFNESLFGAHGAKNDTNACIRLFWALRDAQQ